MKKNLFIIFLIFLFVILSIFLRVWYVNFQVKMKTSKELIGTYILDTSQTELSQYDGEQSKYKKLRLYIDKNNIFHFSMNVPFIYDTIGVWSAAGSNIEEWNNLYYKGTNNIMGQFDQTIGLDTTIIINNMNPKKGFKSIQKIFFKKTVLN